MRINRIEKFFENLVFFQKRDQIKFVYKSNKFTDTMRNGTRCQ